MKYDAIVVGTRVAGAATAMLLARRGLAVLAVDRARFPSDTLSTHQIQLPGVALLKQWGLLEAVAETKCPLASRVTFDSGPAVLRGHYPQFRGVNGVYSPRRILLDTIMRDAAADAGAELLEGFMVIGLTNDGGRVTGVQGKAKGGREQTFSATLVIGADGKHSMVAKAVGARAYHTVAPLSGGCYGYFTDLPVDGGEIYARPDRLVGLWPTNDGATIAFLAVPGAAFDALRSDLAANFRSLAGPLGSLADRLAGATQIEHFRASNDLPNTFRTPHGPGWALVGDAGLVMDPVTGQGIGNACQDAGALAEAVVDGLGGARPLSAALTEFAAQRDRQRKPLYDMTLQLAAFRPDPTGAILFPAIASDQYQTDRFFGVLTGAIPVNDFFAPHRLRQLVGLRGLGRMMWARARSAG